MNFYYQFFLLLALLLSTLILSTPNAPPDPDAAKGRGVLAIRSALPEIARAVSELVPTGPSPTRALPTLNSGPRQRLGLPTSPLQLIQYARRILSLSLAQGIAL